MNVIVQKYGGTSLENKEKLDFICGNIIKYKKIYKNVVVVVSAQGKTTDNLLKKAYTYSKNPDKKALDMLLSTGEMESASLLCMMLIEKGFDSVCLTGYQAGIVSNSDFGNAKIKNIYENNILKHLKENKIVIITGFQASDRFGNITTLGRGGSDLSAVAIASAIKAKKCEIYTDVDGVFSGDPKIIKKAKLIKSISYNEMLEAASSGAKVMHNRSIMVAKKSNIPVFVKNSQKEKNNLGTKIENKQDIEKYSVKMVSKSSNVSKITIIGQMLMTNTDVISKLFEIAKEENIVIYMISFSEVAINIIVDETVADSFINKIHDTFIKE